LRTAIEHALVLTRGEKIGLRDLPPALRSAAPGGGAARLLAQPDLTVAQAEKQLIMRALKECGGNRTEAAKKLGMSRRTLHRKLRLYALEGI
jgi:transcriptional regulator of acetoin/glycerol metabolism